MQFDLKIVTPDRIFFEGKVDQLIVKGIEGEFAVLANMSPFVTRTKIHHMKIYQGSEVLLAAVTDGYIDVRNNVVTMAANAAEWPDEIDVSRAEDAKERAKRRLQSADEIDALRAEAALRRALNRLSLKK